MTELKNRVSVFTLIPGTGGCFELTVDGDLIYSKLKTGKFPDERELVTQLAGRK